MHDVAQRPSERRSLEVDVFRLNGFEWYYKFPREYWSTGMTSPVEFWTREFRAKRVWKVLLK